MRMRPGSAIAAATCRSGVSGSVPQPTQSVAFPGSDLFAADIFHARRGLLGGSLSRAWFAVTVSGTTYAYSFQHNGSRANPVTFVPALAGANHRFIDLGSTARSAAYVAAAVTAALALDSISSASGGTDAEGRELLTINNASALILPDAVDTTDNSLRGMWGLQRNDWGTTETPNSQGGTSGTGSIHLPPLGTNGRILGVYLWGHSSFAPRLAACTGPVHSLSPTAMTVLGQGVASPIADFGVVLFTDPVAVSSTADLWAHYRDDNVGGPMYRLHGSTPVGRGELGSGEQLLWDTTAAYTSADAFGASYTPAVDNNYGIYVAIGVLFEIEDASGNYHGTGAIDIWIGDQNTDYTHGSQFAVSPALLDLETTHHRFSIPDWTNTRIVSNRRAVNAIASDEDSSVVYYLWSDLDVPSTGTHPQVAAPGPMGLGAAGSNRITTFTYPTPIEIGTEALGPGSILSIGFNYTRQGGSSIATYTLPVFLDTGGSGWLSAWSDERELWHDDIPGASGRAPAVGITEYRTVGGRGTMPYQDPDDAWPDPFEVDPTDDSPPALALDAYRVQRPGIA